jgi:hypothetical protein
MTACSQNGAAAASSWLSVELQCRIELAELVSNALASGATFAAKQHAVIDAYLDAPDRDSNSVVYVQDGLRHFWPQMPATLRRHSIVGEVRRLLEKGRAEGSVTDDIDIDLLATAWAPCSSSRGSVISANSRTPLEHSRASWTRC